MCFFPLTELELLRSIEPRLFISESPELSTMPGTGWVLSKYFEIIDEQTNVIQSQYINLCGAEMQDRNAGSSAVSSLRKPSRWNLHLSTTENIHGLCFYDNKTFHSRGPREIRSSSSFWSGRALSKCNIIRTSSQFIHLFLYSLNEDLLNSLYVCVRCSDINWDYNGTNKGREW